MLIHLCVPYTRQIWQCGGEVLIATCSRVGHVFRKISPYSWPGGVATILNHNTQRIADVWMDEYKDFFYKTNPGTHITMVIIIHAHVFVHLTHRFVDEIQKQVQMVCGAYPCRQSPLRPCFELLTIGTKSWIAICSSHFGK